MASGRTDLRDRARQAVVPALFIGLALYLGYHTVQGDRGLLAYMRLSGETTELRQELAAAQVDRERLENRVQRLRPESLDADLLEERARAVLNLGHPDDRVILNNTNPTPERAPGG